MTVTATPRSATYLADGTTTSFPIPFYFLTAGDVAVLIVDATGAEAPASALSVSGGGNPAGGAVTFLSAPLSGLRVRVRGATQRVQPIDLTAGDSFPAETIERGFDRATMALIEDAEQIGRAVLVPSGESGLVLPGVAARASRYWAWDALGRLVPASGTGSDPALRNDLASALGAALVLTAQGVTVQDALDAIAEGSVILTGALGGGANDTAVFQAALSALTSGQCLVIPEGDYAVTDLTAPSLPFSMVARGKVVLRPYGTGNVTILTVPADPVFTPGLRMIEGIQFRGRTANEPYGYTAGCTGLRWGSLTGGTSSVINPVTRNCQFHNLEVGLHHYATQEAFDDNCIHYRNFVGLLIENDAVNGGATAGVSSHCTYEYNQVGILANNAQRTSIAHKATLTSGSAAVTGVADTTGMVVGQKLIGKGVPAGATIASGITGTGYTMSANATQSLTNVPALATNNGGYGTGWRWDTTCTVQGNYACGFAMFGFDGVSIAEAEHWEGNHQPITHLSGTATSGSPTVTGLADTSILRVGMPASALTVPGGVSAFPGGTTIAAKTASTITLSANATSGGTVALVFQPNAVTYKGRTIPAMPCFIYDTEIEFDGVLLSESYFGVGMEIVAGSRVRLDDCHWSASYPAIRVDGTATLEFYGRAVGAVGQIVGHVSRWPDSIGFSGSLCMIGSAAETATATIANDSASANPRTPAITATGGATLATVIDPVYGPVASAAFTGAGSGSNAIRLPLLDGNVAVGEQDVVWLAIRADRYTDATVQITSGSGGPFYTDVRLQPGWQRLFVNDLITAASSGNYIAIYPSGSDAPTFFLAHDMQKRVPPGDNGEVISQILSAGLFNDMLGDVYTTAAPSTGTWRRSQRAINVAATVGQPKAWVCTVAGSPGTWVSEGVL